MEDLPLQLGAIGAVAAALVSLFLWAFKRLFDAVLEEHATFKAFMAEQVRALGELREAIALLTSRAARREAARKRSRP